MVSGTWHYRGATRLVAVVAILALAGCSSLNPVNWYRDVVGPRHDAPPPDTSDIKASDTGASEEPYPSLASVPPPLAAGLTDAQRNALANGLVADREHAKYVNEDTQTADAAPPPVMVPSEPLLPSGSDFDSEQAPPPPPPPIHKARVRKPHAPRPVAPAPSAVDQALAASGLSSGGPFDKTVPDVPAPRESPEPEASAAPPPPPALPPVPVAAPSAAAPAAAAAPTPPLPSVPQLAAVPVVKSAEPAPSAPAVDSATIHFATGSTSLPGDASTTLASVAAAVGKSGSKIHVISHAPSGGDATAALAAYQTALARAKAIKQGLVAAGVPAGSITAEVSSSLTSEASDTAEVVVGP